jgi:hypothetical protein
MKIGEQPKIRYKSDGERYIVMLGDNRAGFVRKRDDGRWNAADTFMRKHRDFPTRTKAAAWLQKETEKAIAAGEL